MDQVQIYQCYKNYIRYYNLLLYKIIVNYILMVFHYILIKCLDNIMHSSQQSSLKYYIKQIKCRYAEKYKLMGRNKYFVW